MIIRITSRLNTYSYSSFFETQVYFS